jgi:hypothetical protein
MVDHRASPGIPEEYARLNGYDASWTKEGKVFEADTLTCRHCRAIVVKNPDRARERAHCVKCNHYICDACEFKSRQPDYVHLSFDEKMDATFEAIFKTPPTLFVPGIIDTTPTKGEIP